LAQRRGSEKLEVRREKKVRRGSACGPPLADSPAANLFGEPGFIELGFMVIVVFGLISVISIV
jgi:hypothetical protein